MMNVMRMNIELGGRPKGLDHGSAQIEKLSTSN